MLAPVDALIVTSADFISETLAIFKGEMISKDIVCDFEITPAFVENQVDYILTDPSRINQLVINILTNAIKVCSRPLRHVFRVSV